MRRCKKQNKQNQLTSNQLPPEFTQRTRTVVGSRLHWATFSPSSLTFSSHRNFFFKPKPKCNCFSAIGNHPTSSSVFWRIKVSRQVVDKLHKAGQFAEYLYTLSHTSVSPLVLVLQMITDYKTCEVSPPTSFFTHTHTNVLSQLNEMVKLTLLHIKMYQ